MWKKFYSSLKQHASYYRYYHVNFCAPWFWNEHSRWTIWRTQIRTNWYRNNRKRNYYWCSPQGTNVLTIDETLSCTYLFVFCFANNVWKNLTQWMQSGVSVKLLLLILLFTESENVYRKVADSYRASNDISPRNLTKTNF